MKKRKIRSLIASLVLLVSLLFPTAELNAGAEVIGHAVWSVEAFTIGCGYLVQPVSVPIYAGETAAEALVRLLHANGYVCYHSGSADAGFYLAYIADGTASASPDNSYHKSDTGKYPVANPRALGLHPSIPGYLGASLGSSMDFYDPDDYQKNWQGYLGEFVISSGSGWMYCVNNKFPNVGFSDTRISDGDVVRVQFTLGYGADIGGMGALGGQIPGVGNQPQSGYYSVANKDALTRAMARANASGRMTENGVKDAYSAAVSAAEALNASQSMVDKAAKALEHALQDPGNSGSPDGSAAASSNPDSPDRSVAAAASSNPGRDAAASGMADKAEPSEKSSGKPSDETGRKSSERSSERKSAPDGRSPSETSRIRPIAAAGIALGAGAAGVAVFFGIRLYRRKKQATAGLLCLALLFGLAPSVSAAKQEADPLSIAQGIIDWKKSDIGVSPDGDLLCDACLELAGSTEGDWYPVGLSRLGKTDHYAEYLAVLRDRVEERYRQPGKLSAAKATEWHRMILSILAAGGDPTAFGADENGKPIDLVADGTYDRGKTTPLGRQGVNGWIWGLIALDAKRYEVPADAFNTREDMIIEILSCQLPDGGWALGGSVSDPDLTAMAVQALAPYYADGKEYRYLQKQEDTKVRKTVRASVDEALACLSAMQLPAGDLKSWGTRNVESTDQVIIALCSLGIDPLRDGRFIKDGNTLLSGILRYRQPDGGFVHSFDYDPDNPAAVPDCSNSMAGEQTLLAMAALWRQQNGMRTLYDFRSEEGEGSVEEVSFSDADKQTVDDLPQTLTTEQYVTVTTLLDKLERSPDFAGKETYRQKLTAAKKQIEKIQTEIDDLNAQIWKKLYPFEKISLRDKKTVDSIVSRYNALSEYDRAKIDHWEDVVKTKTQIDNLRRALGIGVILGIAAVLLTIFLVFRIREKGRRRGKDLLVVFGIILIAAVLINGTHVQSVDEYYRTHIDEITPESETVTLSIRCDTILRHYDDLDPALRSEEFVPPDGVILPPTTYVLREGDTVFDILDRAARDNKIQMEFQGAEKNPFGSVYIQGIHYLYEFSCGPLSGWMYRVDGEFPHYGCSRYELKDGQNIEWIYTCDLGQDVGAEWMGGEQ